MYVLAPTATCYDQRMLRSVPRPSSPASLWVGVCVLTMLLMLALRVPSFFEPRWYGDEGIFAAVAQNMREGRTLYSEAWDNKPPLIFFTYAAIQAAFGSSVTALHAAATATVLTTQAVVMALAWRVAGPSRAAIAGLLFALLMGTPVIEGTLAMTETFMILPASLAMLAIVFAKDAPDRRRSQLEVAAGVAFGIAAAYKQVAVFDALAAGAFLMLSAPRPGSSIARLAAGFALPQAALATYFLATGALSEYWYAIAGSLGLYAELAPQPGIIARIASYLPALLVTAYLVRRQQLGGAITTVHLPMLWLGFALIGVTSSAFAFPHYLQQAAPAAVLVVALAPWAREEDDLGRITLAVAALTAFALVFGQFAPEYRERTQTNPVYYYRTFAEMRRGSIDDTTYALRFDGKALAVNDISALIRDDGAGDSAFVWGELPWVYAASGTTNPSRFYTSFLGELVPGAKPEIMRDLAADEPVYVLMHDSGYAPFPELEDFVRGRYALLHAQGDWRLYRLTTATGALPIATPTDASSRTSAR